MHVPSTHTLRSAECMRIYKSYCYQSHPPQVIFPFMGDPPQVMSHSCVAHTVLLCFSCVPRVVGAYNWKESQPPIYAWSVQARSLSDGSLYQILVASICQNPECLYSVCSNLCSMHGSLENESRSGSGNFAAHQFNQKSVLFIFLLHLWKIVGFCP